MSSNRGTFHSVLLVGCVVLVGQSSGDGLLMKVCYLLFAWSHAHIEHSLVPEVTDRADTDCSTSSFPELTGKDFTFYLLNVSV